MDPLADGGDSDDDQDDVGGGESGPVSGDGIPDSRRPSKRPACAKTAVKKKPARRRGHDLEPPEVT